jgi:CheY-like chemotaxis protein
VVLADDDASIRRLVELALEDLEVDLVCCADGRAALDALRVAPARLLITDLMMPGMDGYELLRRLAGDPGLMAGARLVVFSAGLNAKAQVRLAGLPVWRQIDKPVSVVALARMVREAIDGLPPTPVPPTPDPAGRWDEAAAVAAHFGGDASLYQKFRESCLGQFAHDLRAADAASDGRDSAALRRVAHSLKSVLLLLGAAAGSELARRLEQAAADGNWAACDALWPDLRAVLSAAMGR